MSLRVVGAGLGRTGTLSLKLALEKLLGAPCYHMTELLKHPEHVPLWTAAARGEKVDWHALFRGYGAVVDWPGGSFWSEISAAFPDALILLSTRPTKAWWESASTTIFPRSAKAKGTPWYEMWQTIQANRFTTELESELAACAAFAAHNASVRACAPRARFLEWTATDGWPPLCKALDMPVPLEPFPRVNSRDDWIGRPRK